MKENIKILIISPAFPSAINGLGDYSAILGKELAKLGLDIHYAGLAQNSPVNIEPYYEINKDNCIEKIVTDNKIQFIFLNYVNYGYQKKGIPFWLLNSIRKVNKMKIKIHVFFHELNATSYRPWQSVFWLKPLQVYIYKNIAKISDTIHCSNDIVFEILNNNFSKKLYKPGIYANIPEPVYSLKPFAQRKDIAVIFGSFGRRKLVYQNLQELNNFIQQNNIKKIIDIGAGDISQITESIIIPIAQKGPLSGNEITDILSDAKYGFISYSGSMFGKSGIFAAYAAYGLVICNFYNSYQKETEGLKADLHYLCAHISKEAKLSYPIISENIKLWYRKRDLASHTKHIYQSILPK